MPSWDRWKRVQTRNLSAWIKHSNKFSQTSSQQPRNRSRTNIKTKDSLTTKCQSSIANSKRDTTSCNLTLKGKYLRSKTRSNRSLRPISTFSCRIKSVSSTKCWRRALQQKVTWTESNSYASQRSKIWQARSKANLRIGGHNSHQR